MAKKIRAMDAFLNGTLFIRVKTKEKIENFLENVQNEDGLMTDQIPEEYRNDFGKNIYNSQYYLTYYKKQHAVKCMCGEFFEKVYNITGKVPVIEI